MYEEKDGKLVCSLPERLDTVSCAQLESKLLEKIQEAGIPVIFDMQKVEYISSPCLRICIEVARITGKDNLSIINASPDVKKIFRIAGFDRSLSIE